VIAVQEVTRLKPLPTPAPTPAAQQELESRGLLDRIRQFVEFANSWIQYQRIGQFRRISQFVGKFANSTIFHETGDNCLGVFGQFLGGLYANTSKI
jgi:hypothetical protein